MNLNEDLKKLLIKGIKAYPKGASIEDLIEFIDYFNRTKYSEHEMMEIMAMMENEQLVERKQKVWVIKS